MLKLTNLNEEDVRLLKNMYFIQEIPELSNQKSCADEIKFIIELRQRIFKLLSRVCKVQPEKQREFINDVCELAGFVNNYLANDDYKAITRKMIIAEHFGSEIEQINNYIQLNDKEHENYRTDSFCDTLILFLRKTATETIKERAEKDAAKMSKEVYNFLQSDIYRNFMGYIDPKNLTTFDFYLLMGELLKNRESAYARLESVQKSACDACGREDCMLPTKCGSIEEKDSAAESCERYDSLINVLKQKMKGEEVLDFSRKSALSRQKNKAIKTVAENLLDGNFTDKVQSRLVFYSPSERIMFLPKTIEKIADEKTGNRTDIDSLTSVKVAALGVKNIINFGKTNGDDVVERFNESDALLERSQEKLSESELKFYRKLLEKFSDSEKSK